MKINGRYYVLQVNGEKNRIMSNEDRKYGEYSFSVSIKFSRRAGLRLFGAHFNFNFDNYSYFGNRSIFVKIFNSIAKLR